MALGSEEVDDMVEWTRPQLEVIIRFRLQILRVIKQTEKELREVTIDVVQRGKNTTSSKLIAHSGRQQWDRLDCDSTSSSEAGPPQPGGYLQQEEVQSPPAEQEVSTPRVTSGALKKGMAATPSTATPGHNGLLEDLHPDTLYPAVQTFPVIQAGSYTDKAEKEVLQGSAGQQQLIVAAAREQDGKTLGSPWRQAQRDGQHPASWDGLSSCGELDMASDEGASWEQDWQQGGNDRKEVAAPSLQHEWADGGPRVGGVLPSDFEGKGKGEQRSKLSLQDTLDLMDLGMQGFLS